MKSSPSLRYRKVAALDLCALKNYEGTVYNLDIQEYEN